MIQLVGHPGAKYIELGCGARRHPAVHVAVDVRFIEGQTDFVVNFEEPDWPIGSEEFDAAYSCFVFEHISWRNSLNFLKECYRILKPGGKLVLVVPNTEEQMRYTLRTSNWDNAGCMLFGDLDYPENSHKAFCNPALTTKQLNSVGFTDVLITPYGELQTDMVVQALKPRDAVTQEKQKEEEQPVIFNQVNNNHGDVNTTFQTNVLGSNVAPVAAEPAEMPPASVLFDRRYYDGGNEYGAYREGKEVHADSPRYRVAAEHVLSRKPKSVLEMGCGRGYVLKRLQDAGVAVQGIDASRHCQLTRVIQHFALGDFTECAVWEKLPKFDLCFSLDTLDRVPEAQLPGVLRSMGISAERGLHGIDFRPQGEDRTRQTCRPKEWWLTLFEKYAPEHPVEIYSKEELEDGNLSPFVLGGDGKLKVQFGSFTTMFHDGWVNTDVIDLSQWAQQRYYKFKQVDLREVLPFDTESVDCIFHSHVLEHLSYREGLNFLKECRRILKPTGAMRIVVPNADLIGTCLCDKWGNYDPCKSIERMRELDELSGTVAAAKTGVQKLYELLCVNHSSMYDQETLRTALEDAGLSPLDSWFREQALKEGRGADRQAQILRETLDCLPDISLFMEAYVP